MAEEKQYHFLDSAVTVIVPPQTPPVTVVEKDLPPLGTLPGVPGVFEPGDHVINLGVVEKDDPEKFVTEFQPPIILRVRYKKSDQDFATGKGRPLALAYWDGSKWVPFTQQKHQFTLHPDPDPDKGGHGVAVISEWVDPPIGWGA